MVCSPAVPSDILQLETAFRNRPNSNQVPRMAFAKKTPAAVDEVRPYLHGVAKHLVDRIWGPRGRGGEDRGGVPAFRMIRGELRRRGFDVNAKRVRRLMREENLVMCLSRKGCIQSEGRNFKPLRDEQRDSCRGLSIVHRLHPSSRLPALADRGSNTVPLLEGA